LITLRRGRTTRVPELLSIATMMMAVLALVVGRSDD
jgi:hypothetical protein